MPEYTIVYKHATQTVEAEDVGSAWEQATPEGPVLGIHETAAIPSFAVETVRMTFMHYHGGLVWDGRTTVNGYPV